MVSVLREACSAWSRASSAFGSRIDSSELEAEIEGLRKQLRQLNGAKTRLGAQMDNLDINDRYYDKKYQDMQDRLYALYDDIEAVEAKITEVQSRLQNIRQQKISGDNIYQFLLYFDKLYHKFTDAEKKEFMASFVESVGIYEQEQPNGRILKSIKFRFPVYFNGIETQELSWDSESTVETVVLLSKLNAREHITIDLDMSELDVTAAESKATYDEIKAYVQEKNGLRVSSLYISQVKRKLGLEVGESFNQPKSENAKVPHYPREKEKAITDALEHFKMLP